MKAAQVTSSEYDYHNSCAQFIYQNRQNRNQARQTRTDGEQKGRNNQPSLTVHSPHLRIQKTGNRGPPPPYEPLDDDPAYSLVQLDGNLSLNSSFDSESDDILHSMINQPIPTLVGYRPAQIIYERPPHSRQTIRPDNKTFQALRLPMITNYKMHSLFPKILRRI